MTLEAAISRVNEKGYLLRNLFQLPDGKFQANVYDGEKAWDFGVADTPTEAVRLALENAMTKPGTKLIEGVSDDTLDDLF